MQKWPTVLILGAPGSGKGTQANFLRSIVPMQHISTGDIFRSIPKNSDIAKKLSAFTAHGLLVPDELTLQIWHDYVEGLIHTFVFNPAQQFLLLDGLPRTLQQAQMLDNYVDVKLIIELKIVHETALIERLHKRSYLEGRKDDSQTEVIQKRMNIYKEQTTQVLSHYSSSVCASIDAEQQPLHVLYNIIPHVQTLFTPNL